MNKKSLAPPPKSQYFKELRALADLSTVPLHILKSHSKRKKQLPKNLSVLLIPGFGGGERIMRPFKKILNDAGFDCHDWGMGTNLAGLNQKYNADELTWSYDKTRVNNGELGVPYLCDRMVLRAKQISQEVGAPIAVVGWSLGGCIAREVARDAPEHVSCVVTLGTPVHGGPKYTATAEQLAKRGLDMDWIELEVEKRSATPIQAEITSIISKSDGIVGYESTLDHVNERVKHVDVDMAHLGMVFNKRAWDITIANLEKACKH